MNHPTALVVYNRPAHTKRLIDALRPHRPSPLYVFCDGPKSNKDKAAVDKVHKVVQSIDWTFPAVALQPRNRGLRASIIAAVDTVLAAHNTVILLEDDCIPGPHFFTFMTACLDKYRANDKVFGVTGYSVPIPATVLSSYPYDAYFFPRIGSWGWGTWRDRWTHYERDFSVGLTRARKQRKVLARGGRDLPTMIRRAINGKLDIWTPGWTLACTIHGAYYVYPTTSHIQNVGFNGSGVHCGRTNRYDVKLATNVPTRFPDDIILDPAIDKNFRKFY